MSALNFLPYLNFVTSLPSSRPPEDREDLEEREPANKLVLLCAKNKYNHWSPCNDNNNQFLPIGLHMFPEEQAQKI